MSICVPDEIHAQLNRLSKLLVNQKHTRWMRLLMACQSDESFMLYSKVYAYL
jgi:hypothetical protein